MCSSARGRATLRDLAEEGKVKVFRVMEIDDLPNGTIRDVVMCESCRRRVISSN